jgi:hypothetical protein
MRVATRVEEGAVVRDQHQRCRASRAAALQPGDGVEVEVVGGLVEQQHVGRGHQRLRQRHALLHAARQLADRGAVQVQRCQRLLSTRCSQVQPSSASSGSAARRGRRPGVAS